ncbi:MAG: hypothetical protein ACREIA_04770 [Opitutaceae bacterium]
MTQVHLLLHTPGFLRIAGLSPSRILTTVLAVLTIGHSGLEATAPDSLADTTYRHEGGVASLRSFGFTTIRFGSDGRFTTLVSGGVNTNDPIFNATHRIPITASGSDGVYTYVRISDTSARVDMVYDGGDATGLNLTFASPTTGTSG